MRFLFIMDPVESISVYEDTSFALMLEAQREQDDIYHALLSDIQLLNAQCIAWVRRATMQRERYCPVTLSKPEQVNLLDFDAIFIRKDPPFDSQYLWMTLMLEHLQGKVFIVNSPRGLRQANEKLYAMHFPDLMPSTMVTAKQSEIIDFVDTHRGKAIIKPIDGHGGDKVFMLDKKIVTFKA